MSRGKPWRDYPPASRCHLRVADGGRVRCCSRGTDLNNFGAVPQQKKLREELSDLSAMEEALDELIKDCAQQLFELTDDKDNERYPLR